MEQKPGPRAGDIRPIVGTVFRIYDPPRPLDAAQAEAFRDFDATKIELNADGSIVLIKTELVEEKPDLRPDAPLGQKVQAWSTYILAIINTDGHLRAETIRAAEFAAPALD